MLDAVQLILHQQCLSYKSNTAAVAPHLVLLVAPEQHAVGAREAPHHEQQVQQVHADVHHHLLHGLNDAEAAAAAKHPAGHMQQQQQQVAYSSAVSAFDSLC
jgi:hypothetical protein